MVEFAADFESSKQVVYKEKEDSLFVYKYNEEEDELMPYPFVKRKVDKENSKTWVYLWGLETLDLKEYFVGYDIESFIKFILEYPEDMKIYLAWDSQEIFVGNASGIKVPYGVPKALYRRIDERIHKNKKWLNPRSE